MRGQQEGSVRGRAKSKQPFLAVLRVTSVAGPALRRAAGGMGSVDRRAFPDLSLRNFQFYLLGSPLPPPISPSRGGQAHRGLAPSRSLASNCLPASCFLLSFPHTAKQIPQPDFRQKPCLSGSPRQMNSEFSMPGKARMHPLTRLPQPPRHAAPSSTITSDGRPATSFLDRCTGSWSEFRGPQGLSPMLTDAKNKVHHFLLDHTTCV